MQKNKKTDLMLNIAEKSVSLISSADNPFSKVSPEDAKKFITPAEEKEEKKEEKQQQEDEDEDLVRTLYAHHFKR